MMDLATTAGSVGGDSGQSSLAIWLALNVSLLLVPLACRVGELLLVAVTNAPQVLTLDLRDKRF